jgi:hypothetical protein
MNKITRNRFNGFNAMFGFKYFKYLRMDYFSRGTYKRIKKRMSRKLKPREMAFDWSVQASIYSVAGNKSTSIKK